MQVECFALLTFLCPTCGIPDIEANVLANREIGLSGWMCPTCGFLLEVLRNQLLFALLQDGGIAWRRTF